MARPKPMTDAELVDALNKLDKRWPKNRQLFADNGTLLLMDENGRGVDTFDDSVITMFPRIVCDGGDPDGDAIYGDLSGCDRERGGYW